MKFISSFQPILQLPQGFKTVGPRIVVRGEIPDGEGADMLVMALVRKEYSKKHPEFEFALQTAQGLVGGVCTWDGTDEEMLVQSEKTKSRTFIEELLAEAITAEPLPEMPMMGQGGMPGRRRPEGIQVPGAGLREALLARRPR
jgi:hypothetical protein